MALLKPTGETLQFASRGLLWFIDPTQPELHLQFGTGEQEDVMDPKDYLLGVTVNPDTNPQKNIH